MDTYDTPEAAVLPLLRHLPKGCRYWEPCAGQGNLCCHLLRFGVECVVATDIAPRAETIFRLDAMTVTNSDLDTTGATHIITNPVWTRPLMHAMIAHFSAMRPTWLLFDADWMHTKQSAPYVQHLRKIVSVGRLKWIPDTTQTGKDNCSWHLFDQNSSGPTEFVGRAA
jgi:hypothetical protein